MGRLFSLKNLGEVSHFLGIDFTWTTSGLHLCQQKYITDLLVKTKMIKAKPCATPMATNVQLVKRRKVDDSSSSPDTSISDDDNTTNDANFAFLDDPMQFRSTLGALQYICYTRPDITFAVNRLSQFMHQPRIIHWKCVKRVLQYLSGTIHFGLFIKPISQFVVQGFADVDWGNDHENQRSTSGICVYLDSNPIIWLSQKQQVVSRSSTEAEYRSVADAITEVMWLMALLHELHVPVTGVPSIWCDNTCAVSLAANPVLYVKTKHVELDIHFIREKVEAGLVHVNYVPAVEQVADALTKPLPNALFLYLRDKMRIFPDPSLVFPSSLKKKINGENISVFN